MVCTTAGRVECRVSNIMQSNALLVLLNWRDVETGFEETVGKANGRVEWEGENSWKENTEKSV
jgi:hypothetical protein